MNAMTIVVWTATLLFVVFALALTLALAGCLYAGYIEMIKDRK
jgi:hypothetical protein